MFRSYLDFVSAPQNIILSRAAEVAPSIAAAGLEERCARKCSGCFFGVQQYLAILGNEDAGNARIAVIFVSGGGST